MSTFASIDVELPRRPRALPEPVAVGKRDGALRGDARNGERKS